MTIKALIGLGNPGHQYANTRHNIGFMVIDCLAHEYNADFNTQKTMEYAHIEINNKPIILIKPLTFMNNSGQVVSWLFKKNIKPEEILVVHDELELPFGTIKIKQGGSAKGHNGLRSLIAHGAQECIRLRMGIGRPEDKNQVPDYVLQKFSQNKSELQANIGQAIALINDMMR